MLVGSAQINVNTLLKGVHFGLLYMYTHDDECLRSRVMSERQMDVTVITMIGRNCK